MVDSASLRNCLQRFCLALKFLKGNKERTSLNHWDGARGCRHPRRVQTCPLLVIFFQMLSSHSLFRRLLWGKPGKRPGHLLTMYSSFLLLWSMERIDKLGKQVCDLKTWKLYLSQRWVEHGGVWFKIKTKVCLLQRALPCQKLLILQVCVCVCVCVCVPVAFKT